MPTQALYDTRGIILTLFQDLYWKTTIFYYKRDSFNVIRHILAEKIINNITIEAYYYPKILDPAILFIFIEVNYEPIYDCDQDVIKFGNRKRIIGL